MSERTTEPNLLQLSDPSKPAPWASTPHCRYMEVLTRPWAAPNFPASGGVTGGRISGALPNLRRSSPARPSWVVMTPWSEISRLPGPSTSFGNPLDSGVAFRSSDSGGTPTRTTEYGLQTVNKPASRGIRSPSWNCQMLE